MSSLGPTWLTFTLRCDCSYSSRVRLPWASIREQGYYRPAGGAILFTRPSAETSWPYRLVGEELELQESSTETHLYRRAQSISCPPPGGDG